MCKDQARALDCNQNDGKCIVLLKVNKVKVKSNDATPLIRALAPQARSLSLRLTTAESQWQIYSATNQHIQISRMFYQHTMYLYDSYRKRVQLRKSVAPVLPVGAL